MRIKKYFALYFFFFKKQQISIVPIKNLNCHFFSVKEIDKTMQLPIIMLDVER